MNFIRPPLFLHISDSNRQIVKHEHLLLVIQDKTASFSLKILDIGTFFFVKENSMKRYQMMKFQPLLMKKTLFFKMFYRLSAANEWFRFIKMVVLLHHQNIFGLG